MSFIRPEVRAGLWQWREVAFFAVIILLGVRLIGSGFDQSSGVYTVLGGVITMLATVMMYQAILRARFRKSQSAPGIVEVTERRISYMGPIEGAMVSLDALTRVEIRQSEALGLVWLLHHNEGPAVIIPVAAAGADALFDAFSALKRVDMERMTQATRNPPQHTRLIWTAEER